MKDSKKVLFVLTVDNVIDIITNSSSELFVLKADSDKVVTELLENVYPDFREEYREPVLLSSLDAYQLDSYLDWVNGWRRTKEYCVVYDGFTFEEMYEARLQYKSWGDTEYNLKPNFVEDNFDKIIKAIDPTNSTWLLYSIDENPNWEMQEKLEQIATRYHLG
jgi:hypothetical protein